MENIEGLTVKENIQWHIVNKYKWVTCYNPNFTMQDAAEQVFAERQERNGVILTDEELSNRLDDIHDIGLQGMFEMIDELKKIKEKEANLTRYRDEYYEQSNEKKCRYCANYKYNEDYY